jgi:hypothetical protein
VSPCDFDPVGVGSVRETPLFELWERFAEQGITSSTLRGCRRQARLLEGPLPPASGTGRQS